MIIDFQNTSPSIDKKSYIDDYSHISGQVIIEEESSIWFSAAIRADIEPIIIGKKCNIQENATLHVDREAPLTIGDNVTVGHNAVLHGCTIEDNCLIGMGAIILNKAIIPKGSIVGAGAVVTENKTFPKGSLIVGSPARSIKNLSEEEKAKIIENANNYLLLAKKYYPAFGTK